MRSSHRFTQNLSIAGAGTTYTAGVPIHWNTRFSVILDVPSGITATFTVQGSNNAFRDDGPETLQNTNAKWADIAGSNQSVSGSATIVSYNTSDSAYAAYRIKCVATVGTATVATYHCIKGT